ncbi:Hypothetical_protein [Hexamita inflata]|uniref:Hypothetical_protein n=1 Tax=Hexamita inflata TaxID=28002 RepID=A0AA86PSG6_9EUKA|nr:Hypothetical protein HINF_LOCUS32571 [Hexamita inflata]
MELYGSLADFFGNSVVRLWVHQKMQTSFIRHALSFVCEPIGVVRSPDNKYLFVFLRTTSEAQKLVQTLREGKKLGEWTLNPTIPKILSELSNIKAQILIQGFATAQEANYFLELVLETNVQAEECYWQNGCTIVLDSLDTAKKTIEKLDLLEVQLENGETVELKCQFDYSSLNDKEQFILKVFQPIRQSQQKLFEDFLNRYGSVICLKHVNNDQVMVWFNYCTQIQDFLSEGIKLGLSKQLQLVSE